MSTTYLLITLMFEPRVAISFEATFVLPVVALIPMLIIGYLEKAALIHTFPLGQLFQIHLI